MSEPLLKLGADPAKLYEQFRQRAEERKEQQPDVHAEAQEELTAAIVESDSVKAYRHARDAEGELLVESGVPLDDMAYSDYRKAREAQQRGVRPRSYRDYLQEQQGESSQ